MLVKVQEIVQEGERMIGKIKERKIVLKPEIERRCYSGGLMWRSANLLLKSSMLVAEMTLFGSRFHRGMRDGKKVFL